MSTSPSAAAIHAEDLAAWRGHRVIDPDGEHLGKIEEVFFDTDTGTPLLIAVKSGLLGRRSKLVPIDGARVGPDFVRVVHHKHVFDQAGESRGDATPAGDELAAVGGAYGLRFSDRVRLQSATERDRLRAEAESARAEADRLEAEAREKLAVHEAAHDRASMAGEDAERAEREAEQARQAALRARADAERYGSA